MIDKCAIALARPSQSSGWLSRENSLLHRGLLDTSTFFTGGQWCRHRILGIRAVVCMTSGRAQAVKVNVYWIFFATLLQGIPALVAGCSEIVIASPPRKDGTISPEIMYIAKRVCAGAQGREGGNSYPPPKVMRFSVFPFPGNVCSCVERFGARVRSGHV
jgi:hypothetical protein